MARKIYAGDYHEARLVDQLILNDWLLQRANWRIRQAEASLVGEKETCYPATWTAEQEQKIEFVMRYKGTGFLPMIDERIRAGGDVERAGRVRLRGVFGK